MNKHIANQELIYAFEEFKANDDRSTVRLHNELRNATFLVPYTPEDFHITKSGDGTTNILPGSKFSFFLRNTEKGPFLTIATDWEGINKFLPKGEVDAWVMPAKEVWEWVLSKQGNYAGVEILTLKKAYSLPRSYISTLYDTEK